MKSTASTPVLDAQSPQAPVISMNRKVITWDTNWNNKMGCQCIIHVDLAPIHTPLRADLENTTVEIRTADVSHPSIERKLYDISFFKLGMISDYVALSSHGLTAMELVKFFEEKYPATARFAGINGDTNMAIYFYVPF